jgi:hypothetical protein
MPTKWKAQNKPRTAGEKRLKLLLLVATGGRRFFFPVFVTNSDFPYCVTHAAG